MRYEKGDIVTYSNGVTKCINKPSKYDYYFNQDYYNPTYHLKIVEIKRYIKIPLFNLYKLKTIYKRK